MEQKKLDSFNPAERRKALETLAAEQANAKPGTTGLINMHLHSFFSYNAEGCSPSHLAWKSRQAGLYAAGLCDFDVLDGLEEFLDAGFLLGLRTTVNLETRAFLKECSKADINSPGEPGVVYIMGAGFASEPTPDSGQYAMLKTLRDKAAERNKALVARINAGVPDIAIDYDTEVIPLSPGGCPTERHIMSAYAFKAKARFAPAEKFHAFLADFLDITPQAAAQLAANKVALEEKLRTKLAKNGGIGYEKPTEKTFPSVDDFIKWVLSCNALPTITWLDGTNPGESNADALVESMVSKGACALNIIPDRNHNISDPAQRAVKLKKLDEIIAAAEKLQIPVNIGTEMNKTGQPFADNIDSAALVRYKNCFVTGARIMAGHTLLSRFADYSYVGQAAGSEFGNDIRTKNKFFESIGALPPLVKKQADAMLNKEKEIALSCFRDSAKSGEWRI